MTEMKYSNEFHRDFVTFSQFVTKVPIMLNIAISTLAKRWGIVLEKFRCTLLKWFSILSKILRGSLISASSTLTDLSYERTIMSLDNYMMGSLPKW